MLEPSWELVKQQIDQTTSYWRQTYQTGWTRYLTVGNHEHAQTGV